MKKILDFIRKIISFIINFIKTLFIKIKKIIQKIKTNKNSIINEHDAIHYYNYSFVVEKLSHEIINSDTVSMDFIAKRYNINRFKDYNSYSKEEQISEIRKRLNFYTDYESRIKNEIDEYLGDGSYIDAKFLYKHFETYTTDELKDIENSISELKTLMNNIKQEELIFKNKIIKYIKPDEDDEESIKYIENYVIDFYKLKSEKMNIVLKEIMILLKKCQQQNINLIDFLNNHISKNIVDIAFHDNRSSNYFYGKDFEQSNSEKEYTDYYKNYKKPTNVNVAQDNRYKI